VTAATNAAGLKIGHRDVLAAAVKAIGGAERPGQVVMADAIAETLGIRPSSPGPGGHWDREITGLSGSGAALARPESSERIVVATATLALQSQLANNDIPAAVDAIEA
jgi:ATP-dependent DNA helicase DinG